MSPRLHILRDLLVGQTTADSLALRLGMTNSQATAQLVTLKREKLVSSEPLYQMQNLHVYRITHEGRALLNPT